MSADTIAALDRRVAACTTCPRLVEWCATVARERRRAFRDETYWGGPVPGFGPADARVLVVGLAPAAHGANRTGRVFTGDRSADVLVAAMHAVGLANQPMSVHRGDGLHLIDCRMTAAVHCAPPQNRPTPQERAACLPHLVRELQLLPAGVVVALGALAWDATLAALRTLGDVVRPKPRFGHGAMVAVGPRVLLGSYHPSQQNTFTGRLTPAMLEDVLGTAARLARNVPAG